MAFYNKRIQTLADEFNVSLKQGLSVQEATRRLMLYGQNSLPAERQESWIIVFLRQFQSPLIYVLLCAACIIFFIGDDTSDAFIISGVLFFNALVGTIQEGRSRSILSALKRYIKTNSVVVRDGKEQVVEDSLLVPGDIIIIQEGYKVPADGRIIQGHGLQVDEAVLTGESEPVFKTEETIRGEVPLYEQKNMLFCGTYVTSGYARVLVVATGKNTHIGALHASLQDIDTDMPIKREIDNLAQSVLFFIVGACVLLFGIGLVLGHSVQELLTMLTALFICVVPEGLPVVLTLALVNGVYRMAQRNVLVKHMQSVEVLGRADALIIDKTGTLTRNELMVSRVVTPQRSYLVTGVGYFSQGDITTVDGITVSVQHDNALSELGQACALLTAAQLHFDQKTNTFHIKGDPTNAALSVFGKKCGFDRQALEGSYEPLYVIPFDPQWKYHAVLFRHNNKGIAYIAGSPEVLCARAQEQSLCDSLQVDDMLSGGLRAIAVARKEFDVRDFENILPNHRLAAGSLLLESGLTLLGVAGLNDAIRPEVYDSIQEARMSGLRIIMATGDHAKTALFVASKTGILAATDTMMLGTDFEQLSPQEQQHAVDTTTVFARVTPQQKLSIIRMLQEQGSIVGMTGDGVNDAPALVAANLGIAMGGIGTEVAKQAADIILLDDSFTNIVAAIEQGRHIFYTLRRVILYFFATNFGEILVVLFALLVNLPLPIAAAQILWLNLVTDGFLDMALTMEPQEPGLLQRRWLAQARLVDGALVFKMFFMAIPMGIGSLYMFYRYYEHDLAYARTITLVTMAMFQWFNAWNCRSETKSVFQLGLFTNVWLLLAIVGVFCLQLFLVYVPFMQNMFKTVPLAALDWLLIFGISSLLFVADELRKLLVRWWSHEELFKG